jgi:hypothetical protein
MVKSSRQISHQCISCHTNINTSPTNFTISLRLYTTHEIIMISVSGDSQEVSLSIPPVNQCRGQLGSDARVSFTVHLPAAVQMYM